MLVVHTIIIIIRYDGGLVVVLHYLGLNNHKETYLTLDNDVYLTR